MVDKRVKNGLQKTINKKVDNYNLYILNQYNFNTIALEFTYFKP